MYLRCKKGENHPGKNHDHKLKKWSDDEEDGWFEDEYDDAEQEETWWPFEQKELYGL